MRTLFICIIAFFFCSCATTQYFSVSGNNLDQNEKKEFIFENDTLKITYNFNGLHAPMQVRVFNKTKLPVEIDWTRSVMILNNEVQDLFPDAHVKASFARMHKYFRAEAGISLENQNQFIPPGTSAFKVPVRLLNAKLPDHYFNSAKREKLYNGSGKYAITIKKLSFTREQSPYQIRSYLTLIMNGKIFTCENAFYISEVWQAKGKSYHFPLNHLERGNLFYIE